MSLTKHSSTKRVTSYEIVFVRVLHLNLLLPVKDWAFQGPSIYPMMMLLPVTIEPI